MDNDGLTSVASLAQMSQLTSLSLTGQAITDLPALRGLTRLRRLDLSGNGVNDLTPSPT